MTDEEITVGLRSLMRRRVITGWYWWHDFERKRWTVIPSQGKSQTYDSKGVAAYLSLDRDGDEAVLDHPAGCFYGSFIGAYPDAWHIPYGVECELDHGDEPIHLLPPGQGGNDV